MDRLGVLIERLQLQYQQNAQNAQMLVTIQMIQQEIAGMKVREQNTPGKVAVTMPSNFPRITINGDDNSAKMPASVNAFKHYKADETNPNAAVDVPVSPDITEAPKVIYEILNAAELYGNLDKEEEIMGSIAESDTDSALDLNSNTNPETIDIDTDSATNPNPKDVETGSAIHTDIHTDTPVDKLADKAPEMDAATPPTFNTEPVETSAERLLPDEQPAIAAVPATNNEPDSPIATNLPYNPLLEVPTLSHQKDVAELNDLMANHHKESFNEKLRPYQTELGMVLTDTPVKDLKKAIGINDRFLFISELFRGDETMYERSLKTINNFHIFPEAEYWMERELKIKLGWNENQTTVKQFYQLVKRRFANS